MNDIITINTNDNTINTVIVTRHTGLVLWLEDRGIIGDVKAHVTEEDVANKHVIGFLPLHLASKALSVTTVDMPLLKPEQRSKDLTPQEMDEAGATLATYQVSSGRRTATYAYCHTPQVGDRDGNFICVDSFPAYDYAEGWATWKLIGT